MRNFSYLRQGSVTSAGSAIVDIGDTSGIVQGMLVADYDPSQFTDGKLNVGATRPGAPVISDNTYVKRVINGDDEIILKNNRKDTFFDFKIDDFNLTGYDPHPLIKGKVAI